MTIWMEWPKTLDDEIVRQKYLAETGEMIQQYPLESETHYLIGSNNITPDARAALLEDEDLDGITFHDEWPEGFTPIEPEVSGGA